MGFGWLLAELADGRGLVGCGGASFDVGFCVVFGLHACAGEAV